ncbi:glycosyltransferase [Neobacillus drentensis]|uniref:glycosyltransferase n=1 Tax=Neobacillus drentensis TaxID=220684 RepID=UPI002FFF8021
MSEVVEGLVSILVPSYNHSKYVEQCLNSIKEDSYRKKQLVIIDDGSKDNSIEIIKEWVEVNSVHFEYPIIFRHRPNKGITKTLNEMLDLATGEYVITLASDDFLINNSIENRVGCLEKRDDKFAVFSDCIIVDNDNRKTADSCLEEFYNVNKVEFMDEDTLALSLILKWCVPGPVLMMKKSIFDLIGKYDENSVVEDRELYLKLLKGNSLVFLDEIVAAYRIHGDNSISINKRNITIGVLNSEEKLLKEFKGINRLALKSQIFIKKSSKFLDYNILIRILYRMLGRGLELVGKTVLKNKLQSIKNR